MSFRRIPFQFSSTDPAERQRELEKRFGLPTRNKMYVDNVNPLSMGSGFKDTGTCSSPRLQHRVPIFVEGYDQPNRSSVDSISSENKKPNVRVIPIEIEGAETVPSTRHRTFSGPAGFAKERNEESVPFKDDASPLKRSMQDLTKPPKLKATTGPKVYNIPIKVEGTESVKKNSAKSPLKAKSPVQKVHPKVNGSNMSNIVKESKSTTEKPSEPEINDEQQMEISINNSMKKIESILQELKNYESGVKEFNGTAKDKQYRYLDEMLTRCMLRLDDIDTMGNEKVRSARKNAVKQVQTCIDMLEETINSMKECEKGSEVQYENVQEEAKLKENEKATDAVTDVSELSDSADKTIVNEMEMTDNSVTGESKPTESNKEVIPESSSDPSCVSDVNVDMPGEIAELNDVEMVAVNVNTELEDSKPAERNEVIESVKSQEGIGEITASEKLDDSKVSVSSEAQMNIVLPDMNFENHLNPKCPEALCSVLSVENPEVNVGDLNSQESDVEMEESENSSNETQDKVSNCEINKPQTIPNRETEILETDISLSGQCETHSG